MSEGRKLIPSVTRRFTTDRPLYVFLQAYERETTTQRPLVAFVSIYRDGAKILETDPAAVTDGWNAASGAVPIRLTVPLRTLKPVAYRLPGHGAGSRWRARRVLARADRHQVSFTGFRRWNPAASW